MNKMNKLLEIARDLPKVFGVQVVAAIYKGNRLVAYGFNKPKTHPFQRQWAPHPLALYSHAEVDAIRKAIKQEVDLTRCTIYVARWTNDGPAIARPCNGCMCAIKSFGFKQAYWSDRHGTRQLY